MTATKLERSATIQQARQEMFLGKNVRIIAEGTVVEGTVIAVDSGIIVLRDLFYMFYTKADGSTVAEGKSPLAEICLIGKNIIVVEPTKRTR